MLHVSSGTIRRELKVIGPITRTAEERWAGVSPARPGLAGQRPTPRTLDPAAGHLDVTAGWGHAGRGGVTMPARGTWTEREYERPEFDALATGAEALGLTPNQALDCLGRTTCDIYLNEHAYWKNVPKNVWDYTLGGYQVMKKWLSYREKKLLGRGLTQDEARYVTEMARRIAALLLLGPALDANYAAVKADTYAWPR